VGEKAKLVIEENYLLHSSLLLRGALIFFRGMIGFRYFITDIIMIYEYYIGGIVGRFSGIITLKDLITAKNCNNFFGEAIFVTIRFKF